MKIFVELTETQETILKSYIPADIFEEDMARRVNWYVNHVFEEACKNLKADLEPKLIAEGATSVPATLQGFAELAMARPEYKDAATKVAEMQAALATRTTISNDEVVDAEVA